MEVYIANHIEKHKLSFNQLDEDNKRLVIRGDIKQWNQMLLEDIGGTMPEDLPTPEKSINQIEKEQLKRLKGKKTKLMLDE